MLRGEKHRESFTAIYQTSNYLISSTDNVSLSSLMNTVRVIVSCLYIFLHFFIFLLEYYYCQGLKKNIWVERIIHPKRKQIDVILWCYYIHPHQNEIEIYNIKEIIIRRKSLYGL